MLDASARTLLMVCGLMIAVIGRYTYLHAEDARHHSAGLGSGMSPTWRRINAVVVMIAGFGIAVVAVWPT